MTDTISGRHRYVIVDDSSDEESFVGSVDSGETSEEEAPRKSTNDVGELTTAMNRVAIVGKSQTARQNDTSWLDDLDSDSSIEVIKPRRKIKARTRTYSSSDGSETQGSKSVGSTDKQKKGPWSFDSSAKDYSFASKKQRLPACLVPQNLYDSLYQHQRDGVAWMAGLHHDRMGGLLGDDMGMGKTYTTLTYLGGLMRAKTIQNALVVAPKTVLRSWENEAQKILKMCVPNVRIQVVSSELHKPKRLRLIQDALECPPTQPHLVITTFGLVGTSPMDFVHDLDSCEWDYVVLDEAHTIKNPSTKMSKGCRRVARGMRTRRLILTGTPIMNNLKELWALFDFVSSGRLLGPIMSFNNRFAAPIEDARSKDVTAHVIRIGQKANAELQEKLKPYFLQRLKADFLADSLPGKRDFVVWTHLSQRQRAIYSDYVESKDSAVADVLSGVKTSPLEAVTYLKKLCGHPILVEKGHRSAEEAIENIDPYHLVKASSKLEVLDALIEKLRTSGHRTLIFSQSTKMLDIIERVLSRLEGRIFRIDGRTKERDRQRFVNSFNEEGSKIQVMLLSTKAAGIGLTLTGADRAIIYDPSWNPAEDAQAIDRCYRIGQRKSVTVFRFISAGTVEEKMYEKQVHKDGIRRAVVTSMGSATARYFDKSDLSALFKLNPEGQCEFLDRLRRRGLACDDDSPERKLMNHRGVSGVSSHDILYTEETVDLLEDSDNDSEVEESQENPFSSPKGIRKSIKVIASPSPAKGGHEDSRPTLGKAQRALHRDKGLHKNISKQDSNSAISMEDKENAGTLANTSRASDTAALEAERAETFFRRVDELAASGHLVPALELLMDSLENGYSSLGKDSKMKIHKRMAEVSYRLSWL